MTKLEQLNTIAKEIMTCKICPIGKTGVAVVGEGNADATVVFIGEAPGKQEALTGRPFIGRSGKFLRIQIRELGLTEQEIYITSPVKYLPVSRQGLPGGTPTSEDIAHGRIHLMKQLEVIKPKFVVLLGRVAAEGVMQRKISVMSEHGKVIEEKNGIKYFLTVHPSAAIRFEKFRTIFLEDFVRLKEYNLNIC